MTEDQYFESIRHLWRVDDEDWLNRRLYSWWRIIEREAQDSREKLNKSYWDATERFFVRAKPRKTDKKMYIYRRMAYTPFDQTDQIIDLFSHQHTSLKKDLHRQLLKYASKRYRSVPHEFCRVELIAEALYSKEFVAKTEHTDTSDREMFIVENPRDFSIGYLNDTRNHLERSTFAYLNKIHEINHFSYTGVERSYVEVTMDYFLGSLAYSVEHEKIDERLINGVKKVCDLVENYSPDIENKYRDEFVENAEARILSDSFVNLVRGMSN